MPIILVGVGGLLGAIARYLTYLFARPYLVGSFPFSTFLINVAGCLVLGLISIFDDQDTSFSKQILLFGVMGFLGSYTTFSTFAFETLQLIKANEFSTALFSVLANVTAGIVAVYFGRYIAFSFFGHGG